MYSILYYVAHVVLFYIALYCIPLYSHVSLSDVYMEKGSLELGCCGADS